MTAFVFVVLLLSLVRDQRAYLANEVVRRRQEAMDQAGLLGTVFESINEALVLMDSLGVVQLHNAAAVQILGREKLTTEPARWLRRLTESPSFTYGYNRDGSEDGLRILAVQLAHVTYAGSDGVVAIVRDVTTEQRRIEELASFAAVAAHDLKSPLAAVQGWIEVAEDVMDDDPKMATEALERGRHATDRMSQEIEDWLTYNVAREGVLQPEPVELQPVLDAMVKNHPDVDFVVRTPDTVMADRDAAPAPARQPRRQRGQVHPSRRAALGHHSQLLRRRPRLGPPLRRRRRHRHPRGRGDGDLRAVPARLHRQGHLRGLRPGTGAVQAHRATSRRHDQRAAQRGSRHHDHRHPAARLRSLDRARERRSSALSAPCVPRGCGSPGIAHCRALPPAIPRLTMWKRDKCDA